jgi:hypothetical protein
MPESYAKWQTVKVKLSWYLINEVLDHGDIWMSEGIAPSFLMSVLDGDEWLASGSDHFPPRKESPVPIE